MKSVCIAHCCIFPLVLLALSACTHTASERLVSPLRLRCIDGSVLIGTRNTPDNRSHFWTYDLASGEFDVLASIDHDGRHPYPVPGVTPTRIVWYEGNNDDEGFFTGFDILMVDLERKDSVVLDFVQHPVGEDEAHEFIFALALVDRGRYMLVYEVDDISRYRVWDLSTKSNSKSIPAKEGLSPNWAAPATGIGKGHVVVAERGHGEQSERYRLVLLDAISMREIGSLTVSELDLLEVFDAPASKCIFITVRCADCHDRGYIQLTSEDWEKDNKLDLENVNWLPDGANSVKFIEGVQFWVADDRQGELFVLNVRSDTGKGTQDASVPLGKVADPDAGLNYVVSEDASIVATTFGSDTFEIRKIALPEVTLLKKCRIDAFQKADGSFDLRLVEQ